MDVKSQYSKILIFKIIFKVDTIVREFPRGFLMKHENQL